MTQSFPLAFHDARTTVPVPAEGAVERHRVTTLLDRSVARHPVTMVTGPGGSGKTYAVALWTKAVEGSGAPSEIAWASLDRTDADPHRFWLTVVGALQRVVDLDALARLVVPSLPDGHFVDTLLEVLALAEHRIVLVLDDIHELDGSAALASVEQLHRGMPPWHRLVLIARHDPPLHLHRLRLAGRLGELRSVDLAFTSAEADELISSGGVNLSDAALERLMATTEGWAAGLRLALVAMEPADDPEGVVARFGGRHSLVSTYLLEEILSGVGPERADFLLRTCVVDRVCASLARVLSGDVASGAVLDELIRDNVLVSGLEDSGWYRYHPMLLEMLRARLRAVDPDLEIRLHRLAQEWFEESGEGLEAVRHAVLAGDHQAAAQVALRSAAVLAFTPDRVRLAREMAPLVSRGTPASDPEGLLCRALVAYAVGDDEGAQDATVRAAPALAGLPEPRQSLATVVHGLLLAVQARRRGDPRLVQRASLDALGVIESLDPVVTSAWAHLRAAATSLVGVGELWLGRGERAEQCLRAAVRDVSVPGGRHAEVYAGGLIALSEASRGQVRRGRAHAEEVLAAAEASGWVESYEAGSAWLALAIAHLYAVEPDEVGRCLANARASRVAVRDPFVAAALALVAARGALSIGDLAAARRELAEVDRTVLARSGLGVVATGRAALAAEIELAAGSAERAAAVLAELDGRLRRAGADSDPAGLDGTDIDPVAITRGHVLLATGHPQRAQDAVTSLLSAPGAVAADAWLVTALAQDRLRQDASATESMSRALAYGEAEDAVVGFVRANPRLPALLQRHLDVVGTHRAFTERVLDRVRHATDPAAGPRPVEPVRLTERELSVLAYLPTLSTNPEIAAQLNISVNTVKQHLKTINRKLDVSSRREAVRAARRLGLLPDPAESGVR